MADYHLHDIQASPEDSSMSALCVHPLLKSPLVALPCNIGLSHIQWLSALQNLWNTPMPPYIYNSLSYECQTLTNCSHHYHLQNPKYCFFIISSDVKEYLMGGGNGWVFEGVKSAQANLLPRGLSHLVSQYSLSPTSPLTSPLAGLRPRQESSRSGVTEGHTEKNVAGHIGGGLGINTIKNSAKYKDWLTPSRGAAQI